MLDPDIKQAIDDLGDEVDRLRISEGKLMSMSVSDTDRHQVIATITEIKSLVRLRAERLAMKPEALLLIIDEDRRLRKQLRRRPAPEMLYRAVSAAADLAERSRMSAHAKIAILQHQARGHTRDSEAAHAAYRSLTGQDCPR